MTKKIVLDKVREAVSKGNQAILDVSEVTKLHNDFVHFTSDQFGERDRRFTTHGEWIQQVEGTADAGLALAKQLDEQFTENETDILGAFLMVQRRLDAIDRATITFSLLPWYRRVWAVLTGRFPEPPASLQATVACVPVKLAEKHRVYTGASA